MSGSFFLCLLSPPPPLLESFFPCPLYLLISLPTANPLHIPVYTNFPHSICAVHTLIIKPSIDEPPHNNPSNIHPLLSSSSSAQFPTSWLHINTHHKPHHTSNPNFLDELVSPRHPPNNRTTCKKCPHPLLY